MTLKAVVSTLCIFWVDDLEIRQERICSTLDTRPELQVIGAASDGLEAAEKAEAARKNGLGTPGITTTVRESPLSRAIPSFTIIT
jgi:hypothetical protein